MDAVLEELIRDALAPSGVPVVSEEAHHAGAAFPDVCFIVDPLDGSLNYQRGSGPSAVSIAFWDAGVRFGVVHRIDDDRHFEGGPDLGARCDGAPLSVSSISRAQVATIAGGIPSRFPTDGSVPDEYFSQLAGHAKVRMLGSAATSLSLVAEGGVDAYWERGIMLWDVAAGLALVMGAGGLVRVSADALGPLEVWASNGSLPEPFQARPLN
jgi:myo-inositol-1(or 4)-monophosphatase